MFSVVSKSTGSDGRLVLVSFATKPIWQNYKYLRKYDGVPGYWDEDIAKYALKKYANTTDYEVLPFNQVQKEIQEL